MLGFMSLLSDVAVTVNESASGVVPEKFDEDEFSPESPGIGNDKAASVKAGSGKNRQTYSVGEITRLIEGALSDDPVLGRSVVVEGELSNVKRSSRGHVYLTLKDGEAAIGGILWASIANRLDFEPMDGQAVYLTGKLEIYAPSGTYSLVGSRLEPVGIGALQLAFQQIKARLDAEGLFMDEFKQDLPDFPARIGIITSSTGAVIHDMLRVIRRKNPCLDVLLAPVKVQGEGAALEIARAVRELNHPDYRLDALIVVRGGGSFEDLLCFSEEAVVRAIFESRLPVVTGIGHEPDFSLADAAADYSASTPTAAADCLTPDIEHLRDMHARCVRELLQGAAEQLLYCERTLDEQATRFIERHTRLLDGAGSQLAQLREKCLSRAEVYFQRRAQALAQSAATLDAFNPLATLARGFGIATRADDAGLGSGTVIRSVRQAQPGDIFNLRLMDGRLCCRVLSCEDDKN
jgi:exodeoxyribonuclease VII large subunit